MGRAEPSEPAAISIRRCCITFAIYRRSREPHSAPARCSDRHYQCGPERSHENSDHRFGSGNSSGFGCRHLRNEFQEYAGTELGLGLSICSRRNRYHDAYSADLVQVEGLDLIIVTSLWPLPVLGEGQKSESAGGEARG